MKVEVTIPALLQDAAGGSRLLSIDADYLSEAVEQIRQNFPLLRPHIWEDNGQLRKHVLIFYNDTSLKWLPTLDVPLAEGDRIAVVQAISGG